MADTGQRGSSQRKNSQATLPPGQGYVLPLLHVRRSAMDQRSLYDISHSPPYPMDVLLYLLCLTLTLRVHIMVILEP